jgi:hypothetical protein
MAKRAKVALALSSLLLVITAIYLLIVSVLDKALSYELPTPTMKSTGR